MKLRTILFVAVCFLSVQVNASVDKVIYGEDDRLDLYEATNALHLDLARSTAAMISHGKLTTSGDTVSISGSTLQSRGICAHAKFSKQITAANCSGFLVGRDLLVTAGHCVRSQRDCESNAWVFDFGVDTPDKANFSVPKSSVYKCKEIVSRSLDRSTKDDFALLRLERVVEDREPLTVRRSGKVEDRRPLVVIGHPTGLPTKIAAGAIVRNNTNSVYIVSNLDTFGGNSGSAVFDSETGMVEGILVRGERDYVYDSSRGCRVPNQCTDEGCRGEDVTRITNIKKLLEILDNNDK